MEEATHNNESTNDTDCPKHKQRIILQRSVLVPFINSDAVDRSNTPPRRNHLRLMMLACEPNPPYGPSEKTAHMFLHLITTAIQEKASASASASARTGTGTTNLNTINIQVSITIYNVVQFDYPTSTQEWDSYQGIIIPGSFSSAYDPDLWIQLLKQVILKDIHGQQRKTLAVCFGHQLFAHAFQQTVQQEDTPAGGLATKCTAGPQAGRRVWMPTPVGKALLSFRSQTHSSSSSNGGTGLHLLYTHGDMVAQLPSCALSLGGTSNVDIVAAAYFGSSSEANLFHKRGVGSNGKIAAASMTESSSMPLPYAITFQAHPEYFDEHGYFDHFQNVLNAMCEHGAISKEALERERADARVCKELVWTDTVDIMIQVGTILGWM